MVDVGGNDGAAARDFRAHEFRRHEQRHRCAEALAVGARRFRPLELHLAAEILALGDVDHLLGDDAGARELVLRHRLALERAQRRVHLRKRARQVLAADIAVVDRLDRAALIGLDPAALLHPGGAPARKALLDVDGRVGIGIGAGGVVDRNRRLARARLERDLAHGDAQLGRRIGLHIDLARAEDRAGRDLGRRDVGIMDVHRLLSRWGFVGETGRRRCAACRRRQADRPDQLREEVCRLASKAVLSLRRHDPDQVQRVPAVRRGGCLSSLDRSSPRNSR